MSDTAGDEFAFLGRQLLKQSRTAPLKARMESFVAEHGKPAEFEALRHRAASDEPLSGIVRNGRDERLE